MFLDFQINYLLLIQNFRDITDGFFDSFFLAISHFGSVLIPLTFISIIYWALNRNLGEFLIVSHSLGFLCNQFLKMLFCINRPWVLSDKIKPVKDAMLMATGYSFPSGHTACAMAVWGGLVAKFWENKKLRYILITLILLIAFSRNYLGVHTLQDVAVSIAVGFCILFIINKFFDDKNQYKVLYVGLVFAILVTVFAFVKCNCLVDTQQYFDYVKQMPSFCINLGYINGALLGLILSKRLIVFDTNNIPCFIRFLRSFVGILLLLIITIFTNSAFVEYFGQWKGYFIHSFIIGIFITFLYPWIFSRYERRFDIKSLECLWKKN